ncbi:MAG: hypothetical protein JWP12_747 [Bacteroidetes bacterium]|nr:hypothetical protein [Bacteroidota bacterium]
MKQFKKITFILCLSVAGIAAKAQKVTLTKGQPSPVELVKGSDVINFTANGDNYYFTKFYEHAVMNYHLLSYDSKGSYITKTNVEINLGTFNNTYSIDDVVGLGNKAYAMVEHLDKAGGKNTLLARVIDNNGKVSETETEVMSIPFEKIMNSGFNNSASSPDMKTLAVIGEMPFVKEQPATFKVAIYDASLKKTGEGQINLPGENTKNKSMSVAVGNDRTVYIIKKGMTKKGEITLSVYQWSAASPADVKEYTIAVTEPMQISSYTYTVNDNSEIVVSGLYYERKTLTVGEKQAVGVLYFTNKGKTENLFKTFALDAKVDNLTAEKVLINGNTIFLTAENYKEERITPPPATAGTAASFDYNYDYTHKSDFVIAMDADGNKKFQLELSKDGKARDFDKQLYSAYYICNGKLTVVYNDDIKKYMKDYYSNGYTGLIPVLVQITNDGLMQPPIIFKDDIRIDRDFMLYPAFSTQQATNQLSFLEANGQYFKFLGVKVD